RASSPLFPYTTLFRSTAEPGGSPDGRPEAEGRSIGVTATFRATGQILKFPGYLAVYGQEAEQPREEAGAEKMEGEDEEKGDVSRDRKSTRLNSSHVAI